MASERQAEAAKEAAPPAKKSKMVLFILVGGMMLIEGVGVFALVNFLSHKPDEAAAETVEAVESEEHKKWEDPPDSQFAECVVADCRPTNVLTGKLVYYNVKVSILVDRQKLPGVQKMVEQNKSRLEDAVNTVVRSAEPKILNEPTLQTVKRQLKAELDRILGDDKIISEVLVPQLIQIGSGK
ncbi:MAG: hypothetical protein IT449_17775 [Phycisphaerales bacterium]|nr:hypothetical protein [Phycisphaerales bacterium]